MKSSLYNNRIDWSDKFDVIFNALSLRSLMARRGVSLMDLAKDPKKLKELRNNGFLVDDDLDEFQKVSDIFRKRATDVSTYRLTINPTLHCNFKCWYCYENHKGDLRMKSENRNSLFKIVENLSSKYQKLEISFFGGEPLLEYDTIVKPLMYFTRQEDFKGKDNITFSFTTNGFLLTDEMISFMKDFRLSFFQITLDGCEESHNKTRYSPTKNSFLTIIENIRKLAQASLDVIVRVNLTRENIKGAFSIPDYFAHFTTEERKYISFSLQQVWQDGSNDIIDDVIMLSQAIANKGFSIMPTHISRLQSLCYGDRCESAVINYNGKVYKCTAIDFDEFESEGIIKDNSLEIDNYHFKKRQELWNGECKNCRIFSIVLWRMR